MVAFWKNEVELFELQTVCEKKEEKPSIVGVSSLQRPFSHAFEISADEGGAGGRGGNNNFKTDINQFIPCNELVFAVCVSDKRFSQSSCNVTTCTIIINNT